MFKKKFVFIFLLLCYSANLPAQSSNTIRIKSPDAAIQFTLHTDYGQLTYSVSFRQQKVIEPSSLGLLVNGKDITENIVTGKLTQRKKTEVYATRGVHSMARNEYTDAIISFGNFTLQVRVFNDGVAFRYININKDSAVVENENTSFAIPAGSFIWSQNNIDYYEGRYNKKLIDTVKTGELIGPPVTIELPRNAGYAAITEGGLTNFAGMSLVLNSSRTMKANLSGVTKTKGIIETPWRIIEIGKDLNTLVNCDIIANVSPAYDVNLFPKGYNTDWIKPGRSVWSWLAGRGGVTLENMKRFTDFAAQLGFEYNLVDEGWGTGKTV